MIVPGRYHGDPIRHSAKREVPHISGKQKRYHPHILPLSGKCNIVKSENETRF